MSRIGRKPINIPAGVEVKLGAGDITVKGPKGTLTQQIHKNMTVKIDGSCVTVKGPKGTLSQTFQPSMNIAVEGAEIVVTRPNDEKQNRALHGLTRTLINNMVIGVTEGFKKELDVNGVGYRVQKQGKDLVMNLGFSHQVVVSETEDIKIEVPAPNKIIILGADKQKVGQFAAEVREKRPPEPYKGKGIKYVDEVVRRKEGKTGKGK